MHCERGYIFLLHEGSKWVEIELSAEEQNARAVVLEVAEAARGGFEALDFGVQSFRDRVGDVVFQIGQQILQMPLEHAGHGDHRFESAATDPAKPFLEKPAGPAGFLILPELGE